MDPIPPHADEMLVRIWAALHTGFQPGMTAADIVYLRHVLLEIDDDLLARLLAAKLASTARLPPERARMAARTGTRVRFTLDGREDHVTLVHGRSVGPGVLGTASRYGAALFGLRPGDAIFWPDENRELVELCVLDVARCQRLPARASGNPAHGARTTCISG